MTDAPLSHHLVGVWNPDYAADAMEAHVALLERWVRRYDDEAYDEDDVHVWWGKVRSSQRQQRLPHLAEILAIGERLREDPDKLPEVHLYLTDYRSLYVAHVGDVTADDVRTSDPEHVPGYYTARRLDCDCWFKLLDIRRLVSDDTVAVIRELKQLRNLHYHDRPVSLYGGMVELPLVVVRPDGKSFFDPDRRDEVTEGKLWLEFDAETSGQGAMERELRDNLFGELAWERLDPLSRTFLGSAEKIFRDHRADPAFDFGAAIGLFAKVLEVEVNARMQAGLTNTAGDARLYNLDGRSVDLSRTRLTLGQLAHALAGSQARHFALRSRLEHGDWFSGAIAPILKDFLIVRNPGTHEERVSREVAVRWRNRLVGVGCEGVLVELTRCNPKPG